MFNNIICFIVVLLIFNIPSPEGIPESPLFFSLTMLFLTWLVFAGYCRWGFRGLGRRLSQGTTDDGSLAAQYHRLIFRLSILAIILFALAVYLFSLKFWFQRVPGCEQFSVLQGAFALALFFFYLSTIWYFAYPVYRGIFQTGITRRSFIRSNLRLNLPILFPWVIFSLVYDLINFSPWSGPDGFLNSVQGQIIFFASFLTLMMIFMPGIIQYFWGCKPLKAAEKGRELKAFLQEKGFKYRYLLKWPIFEGRMMTAGIMGILPKFRYILITNSLLEALTIDELKGVLAHEMGHAKYRHLLFYILFFVGFVVLSFGLFDLFFYFFYTQPFFTKMIFSGNSQATSLFYLVLSFPMLVTLLVYFRYVMGFFMRNFERQADLYSAVTMGTPEPTINSLEKIALLSGKIRDLPSWHHFSISERVAYLWRILNEPGLVKRHNRFVALSFCIYLVCMFGLGYLLNFSPMKQHLAYSLIGKELTQQLVKDPNNITIYQNLAMVYQHMGNYEDAMVAYEKIIDLDPKQAVSFNNLAWLLVTAPNEGLRDKVRALELAKRAVALERSPVFLDTLAEAYYANELIQEAIGTIKEAITLETGDTGYYEKQLKKFLASKK